MTKAISVDKMFICGGRGRVGERAAGIRAHQRLAQLGPLAAWAAIGHDKGSMGCATRRAWLAPSSAVRTKKRCACYLRLSWLPHVFGNTASGFCVRDQRATESSRRLRRPMRSRPRCLSTRPPSPSSRLINT